MKYLSVQEVALYLRRSKSSLYKLVMNKRIPHYKIEGSLLFIQDEIDEWVTAKRVRSEIDTNYKCRNILKPRIRSE